MASGTFYGEVLKNLHQLFDIWICTFKSIKVSSSHLKLIPHARCDLIGVGVFSGHGIKMPWTPALYISSLVLSLVAIRTENILINLKIYVGEVLSKEKVSFLINKDDYKLNDYLHFGASKIIKRSTGFLFDTFCH